MPLSRRSLLGLFAAAPVAAVAAKLPAAEPDIYAQIANELGAYGTVAVRTTVAANAPYGASPAMLAMQELVKLNELYQDKLFDNIDWEKVHEDVAALVRD